MLGFNQVYYIIIKIYNNNYYTKPWYGPGRTKKFFYEIFLYIVNKDVGHKKRIIVSNTHLLVVERTYLLLYY